MSKWSGAVAVACLISMDAATAQTEGPVPEAADAGTVAQAPADAAPAPAALEVIPVSPQPASAPPEMQRSDAGRRTIDEVIVTAQRRSERLQDVAISITVLDQEQIANINMTNSSDLAKLTPSLSVNTRFGSESSSFSIRGFTQDLRTTASVATYFAEVVAPRGQTSQTSGDGAGPGALFDLENVQVLKGPQGTLFGRNTTGGAVLIVPRKPTAAFEGYAEASGGDYGARRIQAVVNLPLRDTVKLRLGIDRNERDGHLDNVSGIGSDELGNVDYTSARASLVWDISDEIENYTIASYVDSKNYGNTARLFACNPSVLPNQNLFFIFTGLACPMQLNRQEAAGQDGFYDVVSTVATPISAIEELRFINTTSWQITDELAFKNILAYGHLETRNGSSVFGTQFTETAAALLGLDIPLGIVDSRREFSVGASVQNPDFPVTSQETWVEELQLQGTSLDGRLQWQAGAYYESSTPDGYSGNNSAGLISCEMATIEGDPSDYNCFDITAGLIGGVLVQRFKTEYLNQALYAQATYDLLDTLSVTGGLRYTWDETEGYGIKTRYTFALNLPLGGTDAVSRPQVESEAPTGLLELNYKPMDDVMAYAKYIRGYRQGSVNLAADPGVDTHQPEKVDTYEIGAKTSFGGVVPGRFNVALFYNDLTDMQLQAGYVSASAGGTTAIFNAGKAEILGAEVEATLQLFDDLTLNLSYAHLDTELVEQEDHREEVRRAAGFLGAATYTPIADTGDTLPFAPDHTAIVGLNYLLPVSGKLGAINLGASYSYVGAQRSAASSISPFSVLDGYRLLNLNMSWMALFGLPLDLAVFATNVTDEEYVTYVSGTYHALGIESRQMGQPRMIGARLRYNFGSYAL